MGLNKPFDRNFFLLEGAVKTTGGGKNLAKGQLAVVDLSVGAIDGARIMASFAGKPKDKVDLAIRVGITDRGVDKTKSNKPMSTAPFSLEMVKGLTVATPKQITQEVDDYTIGYDGFDASKSFAFKVGDAPLRLTLKLEDGGIAFRGGSGLTEVLNFDFEIPKCDPFNTCEECDSCDVVDCRGIVEEMVARIKRHQLVGGGLVEDYVDVTPVIGGCTETDRDLIPYTYYTLSLCDIGGSTATALVQAQYEYPVIQINRTGSTSTYQILVPESVGAPDDFEQTIASIIKGCEDCPAGYSEVVGGFVYAITVEDDGVDKTTVASTIQSQLASAKYVANTIIKSGNNAGVGYYTAVYSAKITQAEIDAYIALTTNNNMNKTATVQLVGSVQSVCEDDTVTETAWVESDSCNAVQDRYSIVLPDDVCGNDRLVELQGAYEDVGLSVYAYNSTRAMTLTGTGGTLIINVNGVNYSQLFTVDLTTTAAAFVTAYAAAILLDSGVTVTSAAAVINFAGPTYVLNTITDTNNAADGALTLTGTSGTANVNVNGTNYLATFNTNLTTTAANFVTAHAAAILADTGIVVTSAAAVIHFIGAVDIVSAITILNATGDLSGTYAVTLNLNGTMAAVTADFTGSGCQNKYEVLVTSNLVCDECDPVFLDFYITEAPGKYDETEWVKETTVVTTGTCLCGIRFRGKTFTISGDEALKDTVGFTETSTRIQVSAGYPTEIREGIGTIPEGTAAVTRFSIQKNRDNLGGHLWKMEEESYAYFLQRPYRASYLSRVFLGEESVITNPRAQYIDYALEIQDTAYSSSFGGRESNNIIYHFFVEVGRHQALEDMLNKLAAAAGKTGVQALA